DYAPIIFVRLDLGRGASLPMTGVGHVVISSRNLGVSIEDARHSLRELRLPLDETHHQVAVCGKVEEMAGMDVDIVLVEQLDGQIFIGHGRWNTQHRIPASFDVQAAAVLLSGELRVQVGKVAPHACPNLSLKAMPLLQQGTRRKLDGSVQ